MTADPTFWQELVIQGFRVPIRLAYALSKPSLKELQDLLKCAIIRELEGRGRSAREIAVLLGVSETWVHQLRRRSASIGGAHDSDAFMARIIERFRRGPATLDELAGLAPLGATFSVERVAVMLLTQEGMLTPVAGKADTWQLNGSYRQWADKRWQPPLARLDRIYMAAMRTLEQLASSDRVSVEHLSDLAGRSPEALADVRDALALLGQAGLVVPAPDEAEVWCAQAELLRLIPEDPERRLRTGLMVLLDYLGEGLEHLLREGASGTFGQRSLLFHARPPALRQFVSDHRAATMDLLAKVDGQAKDAADAVRCKMVWLITPDKAKAPPSAR